MTAVAAIVHFEISESANEITLRRPRPGTTHPQSHMQRYRFHSRPFLQEPEERAWNCTLGRAYELAVGKSPTYGCGVTLRKDKVNNYVEFVAAK
jgi:hypothetical protein